ncbi:MAG: histidine--tRNA ligase, partial [Ferruginibacter sp.]
AYIFNKIKSVFELYGFQPLETPAMENLETLMGKYGEEGDKLIFKVLNNGLSDPKNIDKAKEGFEKLLLGKNTNALTERALKYDLTIPFARYVAMNHKQLNFPFKRYQLQPVWRADRPQKGRYREFTQCDADIVGSNSLWNETELALIYDTVFKQLGLKEYTLKINHRKILAALAEKCGGFEKLTPISNAIDKLDKIGLEKVIELLGANLDATQVKLVGEYLQISGTNQEKLLKIEKLFLGNAGAKMGVNEIRHILSKANAANIEIDFTLARGLDYYTGIIFEAKAPEMVNMGSIGGGGRYDNLTGLFAVPDIPGVGISFGVDRIFDVMEELNLFPANIQQQIKALFFNLGEKETEKAFETAQLLRSQGIACEIYHEQAKMDKQFKYAEKKQIPYAIIIGSRELESGNAVIKNLQKGEQQLLSLTDLVPFFKSV